MSKTYRCTTCGWTGTTVIFGKTGIYHPVDGYDPADPKGECGPVVATTIADQQPPADDKPDVVADWEAATNKLVSDEHYKLWVQRELGPKGDALAQRVAELETDLSAAQGDRNGYYVKWKEVEQRAEAAERQLEVAMKVIASVHYEEEWHREVLAEIEAAKEENGSSP